MSRRCQRHERVVEASGASLRNGFRQGHVVLGRGSGEDGRQSVPSVAADDRARRDQVDHDDGADFARLFGAQPHAQQTFVRRQHRPGGDGRSTHSGRRVIEDAVDGVDRV